MSSSHIGTLRSEWTRSQGQGLRLLIGPTTSPTLLRQIDALLQAVSESTRSHARAGRERVARHDLTAAAYGQPLDVHYQLDDCAVVVSFDDDFLGPGPDQVRRRARLVRGATTASGQAGHPACIWRKASVATGAMAGARLDRRCLANADPGASLCEQDWRPRRGDAGSDTDRT